MSLPLAETQVENSRKDFLDLPAEIRALIYPHLLITSVTYTRIEAQAQGLSGPCRTYRSSKFNGVVQIDTDLAPEAVKGCKELMANDIDKWNDDNNVPEPIRSSTLAAFLRKIGPYNASLIQNLYLHSEDTHEAAIDIALATKLCAHHVPSLKTLQVRVKTFNVSYYWLSEEWQYVYTPPPRDFSLMCRSLEKSVHRVYWLEYLRYDTDSFPQLKPEELNALGDMKNLEYWVKARKRNIKSKIDERWKAKQVDSCRNQLIAADRDEGFEEFWRMVERNAVDRL
ncbi:MAG: hypothetical protein Q9203_001416 [Teloschistes exilis]